MQRYDHTITIHPPQLVMCVACVSHTLSPFPRMMTKNILLLHVLMVIVLVGALSNYRMKGNQLWQVLNTNVELFSSERILF